MQQKHLSRRRFLKTAAGIGLFTIVPRKALGGPGHTPPSEELTKAIIGVGGMGRSHIPYPGRLAAVCDVDRRHVQRALDAVEAGVQGYHDFREVLARPDVDIVHIATPPHWHGLMSIAAAKAGKDIWCEKPMTRTIGEGIKVVEAVQAYDRIFRLNTWFRFQDSFYGFKTPVKDIKKAVDSGLLGWPLRVTVGINTGFNWKSQWNGRTDLTPEPVPEELDYDFWLGPAPYKPYHTHRTHATFRGYWDYDGGGLGDMGQHYLDPVQYFLGKDDTSPVEVEVDGPQQHPDAVGDWRRVVLRYADGCEIVLDGEGKDENPAYIQGPNGNLYKELESDIPDFRNKLRDFPEPAPQLGNFHEAVRTRTKFALNESNAHRSSTLVNLATTALRLGRNLRFDPVAQRFVGDDEANRFLYQPMRAPWHL